MPDNKIDIRLLHKALDVRLCREFIADPTCGGEVIFLGTVRNHTKGREVIKLEFEAYEPMAISEMKKIAFFLIDHKDIHKISIHHRVGTLGISDIPVIIGVSAAHRKAAFEACELAIDMLKETVPIWKKEIFEDGSVWVAAHP